MPFPLSRMILTRCALHQPLSTCQCRTTAQLLLVPVGSLIVKAPFKSFYRISLRLTR